VAEQMFAQMEAYETRIRALVEGSRVVTSKPEVTNVMALMYRFNCTRQLHESIVIKWMCKCECRTHRESCLSKTNFKVLKLNLS
jgi:hypothetical protein